MLYRMVDDMIRESMENGDFDNLPGKQSSTTSVILTKTGLLLY